MFNSFRTPLPESFLIFEIISDVIQSIQPTIYVNKSIFFAKISSYQNSTGFFHYVGICKDKGKIYYLLDLLNKNKRLLNMV